MTSSLSQIMRRGTTNQLLAIIQCVPSALTPCNSERHHFEASCVTWTIHCCQTSGGTSKKKNPLSQCSRRVNMKFPQQPWLHILHTLHPPCNLGSSHSDRSDTRSQPVHTHAYTRTHTYTHSSHAASQPACLLCLPLTSAHSRHRILWRAGRFQSHKGDTQRPQPQLDPVIPAGLGFFFTPRLFHPE